MTKYTGGWVEEVFKDTVLLMLCAAQITQGTNVLLINSPGSDHTQQTLGNTVLLGIKLRWTACNVIKLLFYLSHFLQSLCLDIHIGLLHYFLGLSFMILIP